MEPRFYPNWVFLVLICSNNRGSNFYSTSLTSVGISGVAKRGTDYFSQWWKVMMNAQNFNLKKKNKKILLKSYN